MDTEMIDWENIESEFEEDDEYENLDAPKWVDLSIPEEIVDDDAWFCKSGCKHPKTAEDFLSSKSFKIKLLRSMTVSEFHFFRDKSRRGGSNLSRKEKSSALAKQDFSKSKRLSTIETHSDTENQNPNHSSSSHMKKTRKRSVEKKQIINNNSTENPSASDQKPTLKPTFSASNLLKGRLMDYIRSTLKRMGDKRTTKKGAGERDSSVTPPTEAEKAAGERRPLQVK